MVDDGSPDNCPALCDEYAKQDSRVKVIHKQNGGLGYARNSGLELASGEFVAFVDSDDFVDLNMYETLYRTAKEHKLDTVYCGLCFYKNEQNITPRQEVAKFRVFKGREEVNSFLLDYIGPEPSFRYNTKYIKSACKALYSRELIERNKIRFYSEKQIASEDVLFHIDYLTIAVGVGFLPECYYFYYYNSNSITKTVSKDKIERIKLFLTKVDKKLSCYFSPDEYKIHYYRLVLIYFNIILKIESKLNHKSIPTDLLNCCKDPFFSDVFKTYPFYKLPIKYRLFYGCIKHHIIWLIRIILKLNWV
jgi:glycosyltransferase involved in cell wall biosynthesis